MVDPIEQFHIEKLFTIGLDRATGKILWRTESPRTYFDPVDKRNSPAWRLLTTGAGLPVAV